MNFTLDNNFVGNFTRLNTVRSLLRRSVGPGVLSKIDTKTLTKMFCTSNGRPRGILSCFTKRGFRSLAGLIVPGIKLFRLKRFVSFLGDGLGSGGLRRLRVPLVVATASLSRKHLMRFRGKSVTRHMTTSYYVPMLFTPIGVSNARCISKNLLVGLPISALHHVYRGIVTIGIDPLVTAGCGVGVIDVTLHSCGFVFHSGSFPRHRGTSLLVRPCGLRKCDGARLRGTRRVFVRKCGAAGSVLRHLLVSGNDV